MWPTDKRRDRRAVGSMLFLLPTYSNTLGLLIVRGSQRPRVQCYWTWTVKIQ